MESDDCKTFEEWLKANLDRDEIQGLASHGADAGWPGLTYYSDTGKLYDHFKSEIWKALSDDADEFGCKSVFDLISTFGSAATVACVEGYENLMVWYMAERTARLLEHSED
jgi:hypothetical protein